MAADKIKTWTEINGQPMADDDVVYSSFVWNETMDWDSTKPLDGELAKDILTDE